MLCCFNGMVNFKQHGEGGGWWIFAWVGWVFFGPTQSRLKLSADDPHWAIVTIIVFSLNRGDIFLVPPKSTIPHAVVKKWPLLNAAQVRFLYAESYSKHGSRNIMIYIYVTQIQKVASHHKKCIIITCLIHIT